MFKLKEIINGNTITVTPDWNLYGNVGDVVVIRGYEPLSPKGQKSIWDFFKRKSAVERESVMNTKYRDENKMKTIADELAKMRLKHLLGNGELFILNNYTTQTADCVDNEGKGHFRVCLNDVDISNYFPDYVQTKN